MNESRLPLREIFEPIAVLAFGQRYAERSGTTLRWLIDAGRMPFVCYCHDDSCEGFCMLPRDIAEDERERGGRIRDVCGWLVPGEALGA